VLVYFGYGCDLGGFAGLGFFSGLSAFFSLLSCLLTLFFCSKTEVSLLAFDMFSFVFGASRSDEVLGLLSCLIGF
jgi:hypothetical protein